MFEKMQCTNCGGVELTQVGRGLFRCDHCGTVYHSDAGIVQPKQAFLFSTIVAGTTHVPDIDILVSHLEYGSYLEFARDKGNAYDDRAILVLDVDANKLGFVPQAENLILSRLMDAGQQAYGVVSEVEKRGNWNRIAMDAFTSVGGVKV